MKKFAYFFNCIYCDCSNYETIIPCDGLFYGYFVLTIFAALSELERESTIQRQKEGIAAARLKGKKFGRPRLDTPKDWYKITGLWRNGEITAVEAMKRLNMNRGTFYRRVQETKEGFDV